MENKEFEIEFQKLFTEMVEIAFEYINNNDIEIEQIFIYGSMESGSYLYDVFYKKENNYFMRHEVNNFITEKVDISRDRQLQLVKTGCNLLREIAKLFKEFGREVPTLMKMLYYPQVGKFKNEVSYDLKYTNHPKWTSSDMFKIWFEEEKSKNQ